MSGPFQVPSAPSSPGRSPTSTLTSLDAETDIESPLFDTRPIDAGTTRDAYTELNTTIVSDNKVSILPEEVGLDNALDRQEAESWSTRHGRSTGSGKRVSTSGRLANISEDNDHGELRLVNAPLLPLHQRKRPHSYVGTGSVVQPYPAKSRRPQRSHRRTGEPRMVQIPVCGYFHTCTNAFIHHLAVFSSRLFPNCRTMCRSSLRDDPYFTPRHCHGIYPVQHRVI